MISRYDYFIIGFYLVFILAIGVIFRRLSKDTSDYFRCGGAMPWWITGTSAWIATFSAWTFTGAAGKVYETGTLVLVVYWASVIALAILMIATCVRFRRMRVITWIEAVRLRYGPFSEQFYTWVMVPVRLFFAGAGLNAIGVFMASVFHVDMNTVLIVLGIVVTLVAFAGGAWAVLASDFVQMFLMLTIAIVTAVLVLVRPDVGGLSGLIEKVPSAHFDWTELARMPLIAMWAVVMIWFKFSDTNNIENSTMYLMARSDKDARRMVLIPLIGSFIGPFIWFIPSMAATILHPNLAAEYPLLRQPHEAAFVAVSMDVMPQGLLGLLLCAMLGASVTNMDAGLNKGVGIFVRSLYKPLFKSNASEKHLLVTGKLCTLAFGVIIIIVALLVNKFRTVGLFDLLNQFAANLLMPIALPLIFGMFYKRTPGWSAWSTVLIGGVASFLLGQFIKPEMFQHFMGWKTALSADEKTYLMLATTTFGTVVIGTGWYFFASLFYKSSPQEYKDSVEMFFRNLRTPVDKHGEEGVQTSIYRLLGGLCMVYGAFILLLILIPNSLRGRMCFVFCGGTIFGVGAILYGISRRRQRDTISVEATTGTLEATRVAGSTS
ncbi:MAG TPA: transporter [Verrucomicrobiae bacterium]|nr:transporter [Verrucomicrobiae bacterium]